jgi:hypothetical protein
MLSPTFCQEKSSKKPHLSPLSLKTMSPKNSLQIQFQISSPKLSDQQILSSTTMTSMNSPKVIQRTFEFPENIKGLEPEAFSPSNKNSSLVFSPLLHNKEISDCTIEDNKKITSTQNSKERETSFRVEILFKRRIS